MQGFNIRVNFLKKGIDVTVDGNSITGEDVQEFLTKIATKTSEASKKVVTPISNTDFVSIYDKVGEDVSEVVDKAMGDLDKAFDSFDNVFDGIDPLFGNSINLNNPFDTEQVRKAQETVDQWSKQAAKLTQTAQQIQEEALKKAQAKAYARADSQTPNSDYVEPNTINTTFGVQKLEGNTKYTITELSELKLIPGFYDDQQYHQFKYFYGGIEHDRKTFMNKIFNNLKPH
jgi:hypothetical protein